MGLPKDSKYNVASFLMDSLCLGVALMPRSGGFLVDDDKTTDDRQTDCFTPCILLYSISQAYSSILPSDAMVYLLVKCACVWYGGPLIAAGDHLWRTQDVQGDHLWWHKWSWGTTCEGRPVNSLQVYNIIHSKSSSYPAFLLTLSPITSMPLQTLASCIAITIMCRLIL